jgi:hypothetical protein
MGGCVGVENDASILPPRTSWRVQLTNWQASAAAAIRLDEEWKEFGTMNALIASDEPKWLL